VILRGGGSSRQAVEQVILDVLDLVPAPA